MVKAQQHPRLKLESKGFPGCVYPLALLAHPAFLPRDHSRAVQLDTSGLETVRAITLRYRNVIVVPRFPMFQPFPLFLLKGLLFSQMSLGYQPSSFLAAVYNLVVAAQEVVAQLPRALKN